MRLPWIGPRLFGSRRARDRRRQLDMPLAVRRLERRRVLDASLTGVVASLSIDTGESVSTSAVDPAGEDALRIDWETQSAAAPAGGGASAITLAGGGESDNLPPVLVAALNQIVNEGQLLNLSGVGGAPPMGLFIDDGQQGSHTATVDWGDGSGVQAIDESMIFFANGSGALGGSHTYADEGVYSVTLTVTDGQGESGMRRFDVTVNNVRPVLVAAADRTVDEGELLDLSAIGGAPPMALFIDDGVLDTHTATVDWGDGSGVQAIDESMIFFANGSGALGGSHTYLDDGVYMVKVTVTDDYGGMDMRTFKVMVNNVRPVLVVAANQEINEGQLLNLSGMGGAPPLGLFIDDGVLDAHTATIDWGDGSGVQAIDDSMIFFANGSGALGGSHTYLDDGVYTVKVTVADDDGGMDMRTFEVTVKNVRPVLVVAADQMVDEGQLLNLSGMGGVPPLGLFIDDGVLDTHTATIDWGDGSAIDVIENAMISFDNGSGAFGGTHTYLDDGVYTVKVTVADDDGGMDMRTFEVTVKNVRPVLVVAADQMVDEGQLLNLSGIGDAPPLGLFIDDGVLDTHTATIDWGDGSTIELLDESMISSANGSGAFGGSHTYADDGVYTVKVTVTDDDGGMDMRTFEVTVINVNPTVTLVDQTFVLNEGETLTLLDLGTFTDPGFNNPDNPFAQPDGSFETFHFSIDWGDGTPADTGLLPLTAMNGSVGMPSSGTLIDSSTPLSHFYADNDADNIYTITVTVFDDDGGMGVATFDVTVYNVNPTLLPISATDVDARTGTTTLMLEFFDPGADTFEVLVDWGDQILTEPIPENRFVVETLHAGPTPQSFVLVHAYTGPPDPAHPADDIIIRVKIRDDDFATLGVIEPGESNVEQVAISNPGIREQGVAIDTTPDVPRLELGDPPPTEVFLSQQASAGQALQSPDLRAGGGELTASNERYLQLHPVLPDDPTNVYYRIRDEALLDLRAFFQTLPDGRYEIYLFNSANNSRRFVIGVDVRQGRVIDVSDDHAGTRDRPPTDDEPSGNGQPLNENPLLETVPGGSSDHGPEPQNQRFAESEPVIDPVIDMETGRGGGKEEVIEDGSPGLLVSLSPGLLLAAGPWSRRVDHALAEADDMSWQRLRRAGRLGRFSRRRMRTLIPPAGRGRYNSH